MESVAAEMCNYLRAGYVTKAYRHQHCAGSLVVSPDPIGGKNKIVEADDNYIGGKAGNRAFREPAPKKAVHL
jgi:hypothetical protein